MASVEVNHAKNYVGIIEEYNAEDLFERNQACFFD